MSSGSIQCICDKITPHPQANRIDGVPNPVGDMRSDIDTQVLKRRFGRMERSDGYDWICRTVHQQNWWFGDRSMGKLVDPGQHARVTHDRGQLVLAAQTYVKCHHCPLAKPDNRKARFRQLVLIELSINEHVQRRSRARGTCGQCLWRERC